MSDPSPDAVETQTPPGYGTPLLSVEGLTVRFAGVTALSEVSFEVQPGELFAVIGPNGAGKTSLLNVLSRIYQPPYKRTLKPWVYKRPWVYDIVSNINQPGIRVYTPWSRLLRDVLGLISYERTPLGRVTFDGQNLLQLKPHQVARAGIARTFQNLGQFPLHTVLDYLLLGRHTRMRSGVLLGGIYLGPTRNEEKKNRAYCRKLLDLLGLTRYESYPLGSLPFGLQKRADLARALAMEPRLLLLDEPVAGMSLEESEDIAAAILDIKEQLGITQILVEHDMAMVMGIADRVLVLDFGRVIAQGLPADVQANLEVIKAYLGEGIGELPSASASAPAETSREQ